MKDAEGQGSVVRHFHEGCCSVSPKARSTETELETSFGALTAAPLEKRHRCSDQHSESAFRTSGSGSCVRGLDGESAAQVRLVAATLVPRARSRTHEIMTAWRRQKNRGQRSACEGTRRSSANRSLNGTAEVPSAPAGALRGPRPQSSDLPVQSVPPPPPSLSRSLCPGSCGNPAHGDLRMP